MGKVPRCHFIGVFVSSKISGCSKWMVVSGACAALHRNVFAGKVDHQIESKHLMDTLFLWREEWPKKHIFYCPILSMCFVYNVPLGAYKE